MKRIDGPEIFGEVPARFDACIADALRQEEKPMKRKKIPALVFAALLIFALACTALAVAHRVGLIDVLYTYDPQDGGDIDSVILRDISQEGGQMDLATCTAREAIYDGRMVYFLVEIAPTREGDAFVFDAWQMVKSAVEEASPYGDTFWGVQMSATEVEAGTHIFTHYVREGAALVMVGSRMLPEGTSPEVLSIEAKVILTNRDGEVQDATTLTFDIPRTAEPDIQHIEANLTHDLVEIQTIDIARTPAEMLVSITCKPLLRAFGSISRIPEDGRVRYYEYSNYISRNEEDGTQLFEFQLPSRAEMPEEIPFWIEGTDQALVIYPGSGTAALKPVEVHYADVETTVTLKEEGTQ